MLYILCFICSSFIFSQNIYEGYTLYSPSGMSNDNTSYLQDVDGSIFNSWNHNSGAASMPYLHPGEEPGFENTLLYYPCRVSNPTMNAGGVGGKVEIYNWDGDLLWSYELSDNIYQHHHDIDVLPNGNILMVAWERKYSSDWQSMGRTSVQNSLNQMWSTVIFEVEPNLETGLATIVWEWHLWDHLIQDIDPSYGAYYGTISDHPELMDINCGNAGSSGGPGGQANGDWMHVNAIDYSPSGIKVIKEKAKNQNLSKFISTQIFDVRKKLPFKDNSIQGCFSHMLYCMALSNSDLENLNNEICRVLKPGGINVYTVRNTDDGDYKNGTHIGEDLYENDGFIVHFFSKDKINKLSKGFEILDIEKFEEGKFPRKLFKVTLKKKSLTG